MTDRASMPDTAPISAALEAALVRELGRTWDEINYNHFRGRMRRPVLAVHDGEGRLGQWNGARRTLSLSSAFVLGRPWGLAREVLKHEMAHQFVEEILGIKDQPAHGPAFENVCRQHGFDGAPTGTPANPDGAAADHPVLRRIARLLALAESPNLHEAEAAMKQAQRLMLKHNLDGAVGAARAGYGFRHLGTPKGRIDAAEQILAGILAGHFFVEVIWVPSYRPEDGRRGRVLEICGTLPNLEVATWVHGFLLETSERLWRDHKRAQGIDGDAERRRFRLGVMIGFQEKLATGKAESKEEGLVWLGDPALKDYLRQRYPRRTSGGSIGYHRTAAYEHGRSAGRTIVLHRPVSPGAGESRGRLLNPVR